MIIIIDPDTMQMDAYGTLSQACRENRWMKYHYLKRYSLGSAPTRYKGYWLYKVKSKKTESPV